MVPRDASDSAPPDASARRRIREAVQDWFGREGRELPWREGYDPYRTWISEIMLQQTRSETVIPYFLRWLERFPDAA